MSKVLRFRPEQSLHDEHTCRLCQSRHNGTFVRVLGNSESGERGKGITYICMRCLDALKILNAYVETDNTGGTPKRLRNPRGNPARDRALIFRNSPY